MSERTGRQFAQVYSLRRPAALAAATSFTVQVINDFCDIKTVCFFEATMAAASSQADTFEMNPPEPANRRFSFGRGRRQPRDTR